MARNPIERALGVWSGTNYRSVMLPGLGVVTCGELCDAITALKAENERLAIELDAANIVKREAIAGWKDAERALAERAGGVKGEWHRADGDKSILLYTLRQDGWRKGEAVMVNDVTVRIEAANGSESPIEPIASAILSALTTEPAAPEGRREAVRIGDAVLDWMVKFDLLDAGNEYYVSDVLAVLNDLTPSTRPSEHAVTDEMVARASAEYQVIFGKYLLSSHARRILKAAMEAGR